MDYPKHYAVDYSSIFLELINILNVWNLIWISGPKESIMMWDCLTFNIFRMEQTSTSLFMLSAIVARLVITCEYLLLFAGLAEEISFATWLDS